MSTNSRRSSLSVRQAALIAALAGLPCAAAAQQSFIDYVGADGGMWSNAAGWEGFNVPDALGDVPLLYNGIGVVVNMHAVVDKIGMDNPGCTITIANNNLLGIRGMNDGIGTTGLFGYGHYILASTGHGTYLRIHGDPGWWAIFGTIHEPDTSTISMTNTTANIIDGSTQGVMLYVEGTIQGAGQVGANSLKIINNGTIKATSSQPLIMDPPPQGAENNAVLLADGGHLQLINGAFDNTDGAIYVSPTPNSMVEVSGSQIIGGSLRTTADTTNYFAMSGNSELRGTTVRAPVRVLNNNLLYLTDTISVGTGGTLHLDSTGHGTYFRATNNISLSGSGSMHFSNTQANIFDANAANLTMTNDLAGGITGSAQIGANSLSVINNTSISAQGTQGITIDPPSAGFFNNGELWSFANSPLILINGSFANEGSINAQPSGSCTISGATIHGGTLNAQPGGVIYSQGNSILNAITNAPGSLVQVPNNNLTYLQGTTTNNGTMHLASTGHGTYFRSFGGDITLDGPGVLTASNTQANIIDATNQGQKLINNSTIRGAMQLAANSLTIENHGTIEAQGSQGILFDIPGAGSINRATLRALPASSLTIINGALDNAQGLIESASSVIFSGASISGGTLRSSESGQFHSQGNSLLNTLSLQGTLNVPNNNLTYLKGVITNEGQINLVSSGNGTYLRTYDSDVTINGGLITATNTLANQFDASSVGQRFINNATLRGALQLGCNSLTVVNNGLIEAQGSQGIYIDPPGSGFDNNTTLRALSGSNVTIVNGPVENTGGVIDAQTGSLVDFSSAQITGGTLTSAGTGVVRSLGNSTLADLTNLGTLTIPNNNLSYFQGTITNVGALNVSSTGHGTYFRTLGNVTVTGAGEWNLSNTQANIIDAHAAGNQLTIVGNTLRGSAQIGMNSLAVINKGTIIANQSQGISIDPPGSVGFINDVGGTLAAQGAGNITIHAGPFTTAGTLRADPGRLIHRNSGDLVQTNGLTLANGEIQVDNGSYLLQGGILGGGGRVDANVFNTGGTLAPGASPGLLIIEGDYTQTAQGHMELEIGGGTAITEYDQIQVTQTASLNGTLTVRFTNGFAPAPGVRFRVLQAAARTGMFSAVFNEGTPGLGAVVELDDFGFTILVVHTCGNADFNGDGDFGTDADIESFFACLAGNCCPTCFFGGADFNFDGDSGTDADIESFFRVLGGGNC